jgi:hypothetical protein
MGAEDFKFDQEKIKASAAEAAKGECHVLKEYFDSLPSVEVKSRMLDEVVAANKAQKEAAKPEFVQPLSVYKGPVAGHFGWSEPYVNFRLDNQHQTVFEDHYLIVSNKDEGSICKASKERERK